VLSLRSFRILLTPLTYIPVGEAHHAATDALRRLSTSYGRGIIFSETGGVKHSALVSHPAIF
jgi:hypothetical protein